MATKNNKNKSAATTTTTTATSNKKQPQQTSLKRKQPEDSHHAQTATTTPTPSKKSKTTATTVSATNNNTTNAKTTTVVSSSKNRPKNKDDIIKLESDILSSKTNVNLLVDMIQYCKDETECKLIVIYLKSLSNVFTHFWKKGELRLTLDDKTSILLVDEKLDESEAVKKYKQWLLKRYEAFRHVLIEYLFCDEPSIQKLTLDVIMDMSAFELTSTRVLQDDDREMQKCFAIVEQGLFGQFVFALVSTSSSVPVVLVEHLRNNYLLGFNDVKYFILHALYYAVRRYKDAPSETVNTVGAFCANVLGVVDKMPAPLLLSAEEEEEVGMSGGMDGDDEADEMNFFFKKSTIQQLHKNGGSDKEDDGDAKSTTTTTATTTTTEKIMGAHLKSMDEYKKTFGKFWLSFLLLSDIPRIIYQIVLLRMDDHIIPFFDNPILLTDFITVSFNKGGFIALLSVKSLFTLITKYNMAYPNFYEKLYSIIEPEVFNMSYRRTFLELLDMFMRSTHLTTYIVAAFVKKFARLSLQVPPFAAQYLLTLAYNLLRRHPQIKFLVHNAEIAEKNRARLIKKHSTNNTALQLNEETTSNGSKNNNNNNEEEGSDPYDMTQSNLKKSGAMNSSLWEVETLQSHYDPAVATFARNFKQNVLENKPEFDIKALIGSDYDSRFETEFNFVANQQKRKNKKFNEAEVPLEFRKKELLFNKFEKAFCCFDMGC